MIRQVASIYTIVSLRLAWSPRVLVAICCGFLAAADFACGQTIEAPARPQKRPNIIFIFSDDHAVNAISAYGGRLKDVAPTPNIDRLAREGALFANSFCANSICGPSRACILTGKHSHVNGFRRNGDRFDGSQWTFARDLQASGYQTAVIGKWHLRTDPQGFDHWEILPGQGNYYNPDLLKMDGSRHQITGYCTDIVTDLSLEWLKQRDEDKPFMLMCQHKAPHRTFAPPLRYLDLFDDVEIPEPETLFDAYDNRSQTLAQNEMSIANHLDWAYDLKVRKTERQSVNPPGPDRYGTPEFRRMNEEQRQQWDAYYQAANQQMLEAFSAGELDAEDLVRWKYQRYVKNYLATVRAVDDSVGKILDYVDQAGLAENTVVIYSSDQGFYLGEHGWYDKRWMFEESLKMPFVIRWPGVVAAGSRPQQMIQNIDYAPTFLEMAGLDVPPAVQGRSLLPVLRNESETNWRKSIYYAYYELGEHNVPQHFGVRTAQHKLMYFPQTDEWNLFDLAEDPQELIDLSGKASHASQRRALEAEFHRLREELGAPPFE